MKHIKSILFTSLLLFIGNCILAQNNYEILFIQGDYQKLIEASSFRKDSTSIFWHAIGLDKKGETLNSINYIEQGLNTFPDNHRLKLQYANFLYKTGQLAKAKPLLLELKDDPDIFLKLIRTFELESNNKEAISFLEERLKTDSLNAEYWVRLGDNYDEIEYQLNAINAFESAIAINPKDQISQAKLANLYLKIKNYNKSIKICDEVLKMDPGNKTVMRIKGHASYRQTDYRMAQESFKFLLENGDSSLIVLKYLGISESNIYYHDNSRDHLHLAFALDSADYEVCYFLGRGYLNSSTPEKGLYYLDLADLVIQPRPVLSAAIVLEKTYIYTSLDMYDEALEGYRLANKIDPNPQYLFHMASIYQHKLNDKKMALKYYMEFLDTLPPPKEGQLTSNRDRNIVSLKGVAEKNIVKLKEELFFIGELE